MRMAPLDYGPVLLRKPFGSRLTADTLPSGCPCGQNLTVGASPWQCPSFPTSCPCRVRHGRVPRPTRHYPRLWIHRPSSERSRDFNPPDQDAAQHTLRLQRRRRDPTVDAGAGGLQPLPGGGVLRGLQELPRDGAVRDAVMGRLAPSHDAGGVGPPVRDRGAEAPPKKVPELTLDRTVRLLEAALGEPELRLPRATALVDYH